MEEKGRKYAFSWDVVTPDIEDARPQLGNNTRIEVYRLFQFTLRDILEQRYGTDAADATFREAGVLAGQAFYDKFCSDVTSAGELTKRLQSTFADFGMGIIRFESVDLENLAIQLTVGEDLDCSGLPDSSEQICVYDEGLIQGLLERFTGKKFVVREVDCWCTGERTCRFVAKGQDAMDDDNE